jgi:hypothetical protein
MSEQAERQPNHTPTPGCYAAADYIVDFETLDGVSNALCATATAGTTTANSAARMRTTDATRWRFSAYLELHSPPPVSPTRGGATGTEPRAHEFHLCGHMESQ